MHTNNCRNIFRLCTLVLLSSPCALYSYIYDDKDDRKEVFEVSSSIQEWTKSVASVWYLSLFENGPVYDPQTKIYNLPRANYGDFRKACDNQKFLDQPQGKAGSGTLVGPDLILTAGHIFEYQQYCSSAIFIFNYAITDPALGAQKSFPEEAVYRCKEVIESSYFRSDAYTPDFALVRLDRVVSGIKPLKVNLENSLKKGSTFILAGYPYGLPLKINSDGKVHDASPKDQYVLEVDAFPGNSGGPILNTKTGAVEGILVNGLDEYNWVKTVPGCNELALLPPVGKGSEGVLATKPSAYKHLFLNLQTAE